MLNALNQCSYRGRSASSSLHSSHRITSARSLCAVMRCPGTEPNMPTLPETNHDDASGNATTVNENLAQ